MQKLPASKPFSLVVLALLASGCQLTPSISAIPRIGPLAVDGDILVSSSVASVGSDAEELGLDEDESVFSPRVDIGWGPAHIMVTAYGAEYDGTGTAEGQLDLGGVTISAGEMVESNLEVNSLNLVTTFDFVPTKLVDVGLGVGARVIDFQGSIESLSSGDSIVSDETFALPVLALRGAVDVGPLEVSLIGSGLTGTYSDIEATVLDLDLLGEYRFDEFLGFHGSLVFGYRYIAIDVEYTDDGSDVDADLNFSGPYIGLALGI